ncbi:MAG: YdcF family protein [Gemmatimonadaceae bacterium]|nr:YdcF family protein [Gemmatimonadaceae bacterium]
MPPSRADALVVLGRGVDPDGALPLLAKQRVERAAELFAWGVAPRMIFSGRCSLMTESVPARTEAAAMADYARSMGIPSRALLLEEESRDTIGNAYFVLRRFLEPNDWMSIRVVTSDFHIQRTAWVFQKVLGLGYDVAFSPSPSELDHNTIAARAREESDISAFLMDWLGPIQDGDPIGLARLIWQEHPGYAPEPTVSRADIQRRIAEIAQGHRAVDGAPRGDRVRQGRIAEL